MSFERPLFLIAALITVVLFAIFLRRADLKFLDKVHSFWFLKESKMRFFSFSCLTLSFLVFAIAAGDLRGKEKVLESSIPLQKTVVLIDSSASMLVEDVKHNRIAKATFLAKHFIKNSFGHQVALSVFSDIQKKIVPFTDDIEILTSRLQTLVESLPEGGSNVSLALKEAAQFFKTKDGYSSGNILLLTDGEEHAGVTVDLPEKINLAVIGIGSEAGGKIPVRSRQGNFRRYKKHNGNEIVSKLNKRFFESLVDSVPNSKVWYAQSYSLPTNEILAFFGEQHKNAFTKGTFRQRPVEGYFLIKIGIVLFVLSVITSRFKSFAPVLLVLMISPTIQADEELSMLLGKYKAGDISKKERMRLAEKFSQSKEEGDVERAVSVYQSNIKDIDKTNTSDLFNYGTSLLKAKSVKEGIEIYKYLLEKRKMPEKMHEVVKKNVQLAFKKQKGKGKGKGKNKDKNKDQKQKGDKGQSQQNDKQDQQNQKKKDGKDGDQKDQKDKKNKPQDGDQKKKDQSSWEKVKRNAEKKKKMAKVKGVLKQIVNDDGNLQKKFLNTKSKENKRNRKDW